MKKQTFVRLASLLLLSVLLISPSFTALSEAFPPLLDLSELSDVHLLQLNRDLMRELFNRGKSATIPIGKYTVGEHLPAGDYSASLRDNTAIMGAMIEVNGDDYASPNFQLHSITKNETIGRLILKAGDRIEINWSSIVLTKITGTIFNFE